jgi:hypothetical protein
MSPRAHIPIGSDVELAEFIDQEGGGGNGGSTPGAIRTLGPFPLAFDDEVSEGVLGRTLFTPAAGDLLLGWRIIGTQDWNGTWGVDEEPRLWLKLGDTPWAPPNGAPPAGTDYSQYNVTHIETPFNLSGDLAVIDGGVGPNAPEVRDGNIYGGPYTTFTKVLVSAPLIALVTSESGDQPGVAPTEGACEIYVDVVTPALP